MDKESLRASISHFDQYEKYRVEKTLRCGNSETTEVVYQIAADGSALGPYIRKRFKDKELWELYQRLLESQINGLRDPALPKIHEVGKDQFGYYSIIEYVRGINLRDANDLSAISVFESTCKAVQVLHESFDPPIIHRDIKPDNVISVLNGVVLIDFGAARIYDAEKDQDTHLYATRAYAAPEQFGFSQTDCRSDIYSLGMLLVFLETGKDPDGAIREAVREGAGALVEMGVSEPAAQTIVRACAFDPSMRFASVSEMLAFMREQTEIAKTKRFQAAEDGSAASRSFSEASYSPPEQERIVIAGASDKAIDANAQESYAVNNCMNPSKSSKGPIETIRGFREKWHAGAYAKQGVIWDLIVLCVWLFFVFVSISLCIKPEGNQAQLPLWGRILEYFGISMALISVISVAVLDLRPIKKIRAFSKLNKVYVVLPLLLLMVVCVFVAKIALNL